jgi:hypothetical protein
VIRSLSAFANAQVYGIDNDTGIIIQLASGPRDRDKITDTQFFIGARYSL